MCLLDFGSNQPHLQYTCWSFSGENRTGLFIKDKARPLQFGGWGRACKYMQLHYYLEGGGRDSKDAFVRRN